jgi:hypothetical protein
VGGVGLDLVRRNPSPWRLQASVASRPHSFGAAKVGDARVGADARAREGDDMFALIDPSGDRLDVLFEALLLGHGLAMSSDESTGKREDVVSSGGAGSWGDTSVPVGQSGGEVSGSTASRSWSLFLFVLPLLSWVAVIPELSPKVLHHRCRGALVDTIQ